MTYAPPRGLLYPRTKPRVFYKEPPRSPFAADSAWSATCGKNAYRTRLDALIDFVDARLIVGERLAHRSKVEQGCYWCEPCSAYHLTAIAMEDIYDSRTKAARAW